MRAAPWLMFCVAVSLSASVAAKDSPSRLERARALFAEATELSQAEQWDEAAAKFRASLELKRHPMTLYSLGVSLREGEHPLAALRSFRAFLAEPSDGPDATVFRRAAQKAVSELVSQVGRLIVHTAPSHASVFVDGEPCVSNAEPCFVTAGTHKVEIKATGYEDRKRTVKVAAGATVDVDLSMDPSSTPALPLVLLGIGGAAFVGGFVLTIIGVDGSVGTMDPSAAAMTEIAVGNTLMASGLAGVAAGWTWLALEPEADEIAAAPFVVAPYVSAGTAGVRIRF